MKEETVEKEFEEFDVFELRSLGELVLDKVKECFEKLDSDLDEIYTIDYNLRLFEKLSRGYLVEIQRIHKRNSDWELERNLKMAKLELKQLRKKGGKNGRRN